MSRNTVLLPVDQLGLLLAPSPPGTQRMVTYALFAGSEERTLCLRGILRLHKIRTVIAIRLGAKIKGRI